MKALLHALLELSLVVAIVGVVWTAPTSISALTGRTSVDEQLLCSSWAADEERFEDVLRRGACPVARDNVGATPLHYAATNGDACLVRRLIALGADVDAENNGKSTPIMNAATNDHAEVVEILLRAGARPTDQVLEAAVLAKAGEAERVLRRWRVVSEVVE